MTPKWEYLCQIETYEGTRPTGPCGDPATASWVWDSDHSSSPLFACAHHDKRLQKESQYGRRRPLNKQDDNQVTKQLDTHDIRSIADTARILLDVLEDMNLSGEDVPAEFDYAVADLRKELGRPPDIDLISEVPKLSDVDLRDIRSIINNELHKRYENAKADRFLLEHKLTSQQGEKRPVQNG